MDLSVYPWKFEKKQNFTFGCSTKLCGTHWKFQGEKPRAMETPHDFLLITVGFDHCWKFHFFFN